MSAISWMSLVWFGFVLALVPAGLWLLKRSGIAGGLARTGGGQPRLMGSLALGPQQRVVTIEVGEGAARRWLVLGVTSQQVTTLMRSSQPLTLQPDAQPQLGQGAAPGAASAVPASGRGFSQVLARALGGRVVSGALRDRATDASSREARGGEPRVPVQRGRSDRVSRTAPGGLSTLSAQPDSAFPEVRRSGFKASAARQDARLQVLREQLARGG